MKQKESLAQKRDEKKTATTLNLRSREEKERDGKRARKT